MTELSLERLKELFWYDPIVGVFVKRTNGKGVGNDIGFIPSKTNSSGYVRIMIDGTRYQAHRLAMFYQTGVMPKDEVDHKNLIKNDNSFNNLREATHVQNMANQGARRSNTSGCVGVYLDKPSGKWRAILTASGKTIHLGRFNNKDAAVMARRQAETTYYGEFACSR